MNKQDFYFELPSALIAQYPLEKRSDSRLLHYDRQEKKINHHHFFDLPDLLLPGDLLVMNNSRVMPARLYGKKDTGGQVEILVERIVEEDTFWAHIKASKAPQPGRRIFLGQQFELTVLEKNHDLYCLQSSHDVKSMLSAIGQLPLPPYIERACEPSDSMRYQTIYAQEEGSVAAPTAGLHFDEPLIARLKAKAIQLAHVTLHVGAGTFQPVREENIMNHRMHREYYVIDQSLCEAIQCCRASGGRVIAVGTTAMRTLESAARFGDLQPQARDTDIFIYPGYTFKLCDGLITNFHLPESTLLMLVSAWMGHQETMHLYQVAIEEGYRFFSYGDASLLL